MVILDLSIVNVALPSIQSSLGLLLAGAAVGGRRVRDHVRGLPDDRRPRGRLLRPAPHVRVRRWCCSAIASLAGGAAPDQGTLVGARARAGPRGRADGGVLAGDHHRVVRARPEAAPRDRHVGGDERPRRRRGRAARRDHHRSAELALGAADQPADRASARRWSRTRWSRSAAARRNGASFDLAGALTLTLGQMVLVFGVVEAGLKGWSTFAALGPIIARHRAAGGLRADRGARRAGAADPLQGAHHAAAGRQHDRAAVQRGAVPDVVRELAVPAAGARASRRCTRA